MRAGTKHSPVDYGRLFRRGGLLWAALAAVWISNAPHATPVALAQQPPIDDSELIGAPWTGEIGVNETIDEIMARDALLTPAERGQHPPVEAEDVEHEYPDRSGLPQDIDAPPISAWPFAAPLDSQQQSAAGPEPSGGLNGGGMPLNPQTVGTSFLGVQISESGFIPPDTMAAAGPTQIVVIANGRVKVFSKSGTLGPLNTTTDNFFASVRSAATSDPRVRFDRTSDRWFVSMIDVATPNRVLLAVSSGPTISGQSSFTFFFFQFDTVPPTNPADTGGVGDYDTLAVDVNAVYIGVNVFNPNFRGTTGFVVQKTSVLGGGPIVVKAFRQMGTNSGGGPYSPSGADNWDPNATEGYFVGVSTNTFGRLCIRRVSNPGGTPTLGAIMNLTVPSTATPLPVPAEGSPGNPLDSIDDRHFNAMIKQDRSTGATTLWLAHTIRCNSSGVGGGTGDRNGSRWYQVGNLTSTPTLIQSGTLFDTAGSNPRFFWFPSVAQSGQGHMALGCSAAGNTEHAEAAVAGRLSSDALGTTQPPTTAQTSSTSYNLQAGTQRWGDYSHTCVDPTDDQTMWTAQEYCNTTDSWGVRIVKLIAPPPATPTSCTPATVNQGDTNVNIAVTGASTAGSGFYDTDDSYTQRLSAAFGGTGITINSVTFVDPTDITLNITVSPSAPSGARSLTVTNPDGQSATSATGILTVNGGCAGPTITGQPATQTVCAGGSATFSVTANGTPPLSYQWRKNTGNIGGATASSYTINPVSGGDAASYDCVVTNGCGSATSNAAFLTVNTGPSITTHPQSQTRCVGQSVTFSVIAGGTPPLSYQWRKNTSNIPGATASSYSIAAVTAGDQGSYDCVVTNTCGSTTSNAATLTVNTGPSIATQPQSQTVCVGQPATFSVVANGTPSLSYQWRKDTVNIPGATASSYSIAAVTAGDQGSYDCVVTNTCGSTTSNAATLTVNTGPSIVTQPQSQTVCVGQPATFSVVANGTAPLGYQWRKDTVNIGGATGSSYTITSVAAGDAASYDSVVTNSCGSATSNAAVLAVNNGPSITTQPQSQTTCTGQPATFTVVADGTPPLGYQWRKDTVDIAGATASSYTIAAVANGDGGSYDCVITNSCGSTTSNAALLTVNTGPAITTQPQSQAVCVGQPATFSVVADGSPPPGYQWRKDTVDVPGATASSYTIAAVAAGDAASYDCVVANSCGSATSNSAVLTVNTGLSITAQPQSQSPCVGQPVTFTVVADGAPPPSYQWRKDTSDIPGATTSQFSIAAVTVGDAGSYDCVITNPCGVVTSDAAALAVNTGPSITTQPESEAACSGQPATFSVIANGAPPLSYQWRKDTVDIDGATSSSYTIAAVVPGDAGSYDCNVTDGCGSTLSNAATLVVNGGPLISTQPQSQAQCVGQPATFSLVANGTPPLSYQWRKDTVDIDGATASSYTIAAVGAGDAGSYDCTVTSTCGSTTSDAAVLTVSSAPSITTQPLSQSACTDQPATFTVAADGTPPLGYQWRFNTVEIAGATSSSYTIPSVTAGDAGDFDCVITDTCGSVTSAVATLTVETSPTLTSQPQSQTRHTGQAVTFSVAADGSPPLSYQWRQDSVEISGATADSYTIASVAVADAGTYDCLIANACGATSSDGAVLTVWPTGDLNCSGTVDFDDINPFVLALSSQAAYEAAFPACYFFNGDCNLDGAVDFDDINPFVALLTGS